MRIYSGACSGFSGAWGSGLSAGRFSVEHGVVIDYISSWASPLSTDGKSSRLKYSNPATIPLAKSMPSGQLVRRQPVIPLTKSVQGEPWIRLGIGWIHNSRIMLRCDISEPGLSTLGERRLSMTSFTLFSNTVGACVSG